MALDYIFCNFVALVMKFGFYRCGKKVVPATTVVGAKPERMAPTGSLLTGEASLSQEVEVLQLVAGSRGGDGPPGDDKVLEMLEILLIRGISETLRDSWSMSAASSMVVTGHTCSHLRNNEFNNNGVQIIQIYH
jgi:hypothetical protein